MSSSQHSKAGPQMYTVATAVIADVPVKIWTLLDAPQTGGVS